MVDVDKTINAELVAFRRYLLGQRRLRFALLTVLVLCALWFVAALLNYFDLGFDKLAPLVLIASGFIIIAAVVLEIIGQPSLQSAAALLDDRLDGMQRVTTALELGEQAERSEMAEQQLSNTVRTLASLKPREVYAPRQPWFAAWLSGALVCLSFGLVLLKLAAPGVGEVQAGVLPTQAPLSNAAQNAEGTPTTGPDLSQNLDQQREDSDLAVASLLRLAQALDSVSVTHDAAMSLRQRAYEQAAQQVTDVGQQSDQLSEEARGALATALAGAASATASLPNLQNAEQGAANALGGGDYRSMVAALRILGQAIRDTAAKVIDQAALAQALATPSKVPTPGADAVPEQALSDPAEVTPGASNPRAPGLPEEGTPDNVAGDDSTSGSSAGNAPSRITGPADETQLNVEGNPFALEGEAGSGATIDGEADGPPALTMEGNGTAASFGASTNASGESPPGDVNRPPLDRRDVVRDYFDPNIK